MTETELNLSKRTEAIDSHRHVWTRPGVLAGVVVAVLVYGSLIPFDFAWSAAVEQSGGIFPAMLDTLASPQWVAVQSGQSTLGVSFAVSDLLLNALLYLPLGVTLRMALRVRWKNGPAEVFGTAVIAFTLSWTVESLQGLMPTRVASLSDVLANTGSALVGGLVAPWLWTSYRRVSFWLYCRLAGVKRRLRRLARRPSVAITIAVLNALVIGLWYVAELQKAGIGRNTAFALPFERAFELPYDLGVLVLGEALLAYAGIGCLLLLLTYTGMRRVAMGWAVLGVVALAFSAELSRAATHDSMPDITGPLLALSAAGIMTVTVYTFTYAVQRSNRRHRAQAFDGPDRRRASHDYV